MPEVSYSRSVAGAGMALAESVVRTSDHLNSYVVSLPIAEGGSLTTRTSDTAGTITMTDASHGITTGEVVDIYWAGGVAYGATVGTVSGTSVPFTGASGDVLPSASTAVTVAEQVDISTYIDGDNALIVAIILETPDGSSGKGHLDMQDVGAATIEEIDLVGDELQVWDITGGDTNVFTGNIIELTKASNGATTNAATLKILSLEDRTP